VKYRALPVSLIDGQGFNPRKYRYDNRHRAMHRAGDALLALANRFLNVVKPHSTRPRTTFRHFARRKTRPHPSTYQTLDLLR
jgi:hypothetical protein